MLFVEKKDAAFAPSSFDCDARGERDVIVRLWIAFCQSSKVLKFSLTHCLSCSVLSLPVVLESRLVVWFVTEISIISSRVSSFT